MSGEAEVKHCLEAMAACTQDDIVHWNWSIELVNSQVGRMREGRSVQHSNLYFHFKKFHRIADNFRKGF
jgi:hypothetical protein